MSKIIDKIKNIFSTEPASTPAPAPVVEPAVKAEEPKPVAKKAAAKKAPAKKAAAKKK